MHGSACPVIRENKFLFPISVLGLIFIIAIGAFYQHKMRASSLLNSIVPDQAVYSSWYSGQNEANYFMPKEDQTQTLSLEDSSEPEPKS